MYHRILVAFISVALLTGSAFGTTTTRKKRHRVVRNTVAVARVRRASYTPTASPAPKPLLTSRHVVPRGRKFASPWTSPTFAEVTLGDSVDGEDLVARRAAVQALGPYNGAVVVADPNTGRILSVVNQKLAYQGAFEPCSTIKIVAALAGLNEGIINQESALHITKHHSMDLTEAIAHSNNAYFASVGEKLGYDKIVQYGKMFGLGGKAGFNY